MGGVWKLWNWPGVGGLVWNGASAAVLPASSHPRLWCWAPAQPASGKGGGRCCQSLASPEGSREGLWLREVEELKDGEMLRMTAGEGEAQGRGQAAPLAGRGGASSAWLSLPDSSCV